MGFFSACFSTHLDQYKTPWFVSSSFCSASQVFIFRTIFAVWSFTILVYSLVLELAIQRSPVWQWFSYFTHFGWIGLTYYFISASVYTGLYISNPTKYTAKFEGQHSLLKWVQWNSFILSAVFETVIVLVWWLLLSSSDIAAGYAPNLFLDANVHTLGIPLMLVELFLNRIPIFASQWTVVIGTAFLYLCLALIIHAIYPPYFPYSFMDYTKSGWYLWYIGLFVGFAVIFFIWFGVAKLRNLIEKSGKNSKIITPDPNQRSVSEMTMANQV